MIDTEAICVWIAELVPLAATLFSLFYGIKHFFKKGKPLFLQTLTMAMGCHALGSLYHLCLTLTSEELLEGFTPAYLGRIGFFLFLLTASYAQLDKIVDDGTVRMRKARLIALVAPVLVILLFIPNAMIEEVPLSTKITYASVWLPAIFSVYFNLKHTLIPNLDFGFVRAIKPYNALALALSFAELLVLTAWDYYYLTQLVLTAFLFAALAIATMIAAKKGAEQWVI